MRRKYCGACDEAIVPASDGDCPMCGGPLEVIPRENPRERGDDDGIEYADPRDKKAGLE